jgi:hypothetical protein
MHRPGHSLYAVRFSISRSNFNLMQARAACTSCVLHA